MTHKSTNGTLSTITAPYLASIVFKLIIFCLFLWVASPILMPVVLGGFFAVAMYPTTQALSLRLGRMHASAPLIMTISSLLLGVVPLIFVITQATQALLDLINQLNSSNIYSTLFISRINKLIVDLGWFSQSALQSMIEDGTRRLVASTARALPGNITSLFLFSITLYFGLRDGKKFTTWIKNIAPISKKQTLELFAAVEGSVRGAILGTIVVAFVQGAFVFIVLLALQVPSAFLWASIATILSVIPIVGTTPITVGVTIYLFMMGHPISALIMLGAAVAIGLIDNVIRPWVQSSHDHMHPLIALIAIFGGLSLMGFVGIFVGPVLASMAIWALTSLREKPSSPIEPTENSLQ